ncbi:hypothetical protein BpHYR1_050674 [Brachionus plicatilis]|uniref:Uncharacterized protein n=1 Tax=Brachionus plicatilis TaxID=10195 RepID=A0A3M7SLY3_BRAPC|nr:hypothetical protein BpHYR1_050674 [Brachionus plicatilis]
MFTLVPLGPSIRSPSLDVLEHVFMLLLNLNAHVIWTKMSLYHTDVIEEPCLVAIKINQKK